MANTELASDKHGWFQLYKPTQGYWTRMGTALGAGALVLWGTSWIFGRLSIYRSWEYGLYVQVIVSLIFLVGLGVLLFWLVGKKPTTVDFFISVEGEMKKVNWSSKAEITGATKVVILFTLLMSLLLVIVDTVFATFFSAIGVLKGPGLGSIVSDIIHSLGSLFGK